MAYQNWPHHQTIHDLLVPGLNHALAEHRGTWRFDVDPHCNCTLVMVSQEGDVETHPVFSAQEIGDDSYKRRAASRFAGLKHYLDSHGALATEIYNRTHTDEPHEDPPAWATRRAELKTFKAS